MTDVKKPELLDRLRHISETQMVRFVAVDIEDLREVVRRLECTETQFPHGTSLRTSKRITSALCALLVQFCCRRAARKENQCSIHSP